jgi:hypothetical protein
MARDQGAYSVSRRIICRALAGVLVAPVIARAQTSKVRRIGVVEPGPVYEWIAKGRADALRGVGWVEGENLQVERRYYAGRRTIPQSLLLRADEVIQ